MKKIFITCAAILALFSSCTSVLDKEDLSSISEDKVWVDKTLTTAFLNALYVSIPSWDTAAADATDEATGGGNWTQGTTTPDNMSDTKDSAPTWYWPYSDIRNCNIFIQNAQNPEVCTIDRELADRLTYEARFIRAYLYFEMVKRYGGVPLITIPQEMTDDLYVKRNSTKECFDFIIDELKACAEGLPDSHSAEDLGRVTKGAAKAFLGRVFLFRASPQFNPNNNNEHWQTAYNYNKETLNYLIGQGHALYDDYGKLFLDEMNKEVIFAIRYENPTRTQKRDATVRPITFSMNNTGGNHPTQEVIDRFPTIDGGTYTYADWEKEGKDIFALWENRDKRFYATIVYQGVTYFNTVMELNENAQNDYAYGKNVGSKTGYYSRKAIDESLSVTDCQKSGTDYIDIRLAEVMLNYAEAAVEVGKTNEAFDMLKQIRKRAGINETSSNPEMKGKVYGLNPNMNQTEMREAVREERFIELLFEQKRLWDMRRWMIYDKLMNGQGKRHALVMNKQADNTYTTYLFDRDNTPMITNQNIYFLPMKSSEMSNNPNLEQTKGWENEGLLLLNSASIGFPIWQETMSELEVDKWLHPGTLELHDNKDRNRQHHRLNKQRRTGNDCLQTVFRRFRHEMQDITHHHQDEHSFIAHHKLHKDLRMEIRENLRQHLANRLHRVSPEQNPAKAHQMESDQNTYHSSPGFHF